MIDIIPFHMANNNFIIWRELSQFHIKPPQIAIDTEK